MIFFYHEVCQVGWIRKVLKKNETHKIEIMILIYRKVINTFFFEKSSALRTAPSLRHSSSSYLFTKTLRSQKKNWNLWNDRNEMKLILIKTISCWKCQTSVNRSENPETGTARRAAVRKTSRRKNWIIASRRAWTALPRKTMTQACNSFHSLMKFEYGVIWQFFDDAGGGGHTPNDGKLRHE